MSKLRSTSLLRLLLQFSPKKKQLFKTKLLQKKQASMGFVRKAGQRQLTQPTDIGSLGLVPLGGGQGPVVIVHKGETALKNLGPDRVFRKRTNLRGLESYRRERLTPTQQRALRQLKPATIGHTISRRSTLPAHWATNYMQVLKNISGLHKTDSETKKFKRLLKSMSRDLYIEGRGEAFIPEPDTQGYYPVFENIPYKAIQTAIRKNTSTARRLTMWSHIANSGSPYKISESQSDLNAIQQRHFLAHAVVGLPHKKGRHPALLGRAVPGQLIGRSGSVIDIKDIDPEEWAKGGFTPMKFSSNTKIEKRRAKFTKLLPKMGLARKLERRMAGPENISRQQAQTLAKRLQAPGYKTFINKKYPGLTNWRAKAISSSPHAAIVAHEATHSRQHAKLGKGFGALYKGLPAIGTGVGLSLAQMRAMRLKRLRRLPRWVAPAVIAGSLLPKLGIEAHAAWKARKFKGGKRAAMVTGGSYLGGAVAHTAVVTKGGHLIGKRLRHTQLKQTKLHRISRAVMRTASRRPMKFALRYRFLGGKRAPLIKKVRSLLGGYLPGVSLRKKLGPPDTRKKVAIRLAKKLTPKGTAVVIGTRGYTGGSPMYDPTTRILFSPRSRPIIAHEAAHARLIEKFPKSATILPILGQTIGEGGAVIHGIKAGRRKEDKHKHLKKGAVWGGIGFLPILGREAHANVAAFKQPRGSRFARVSMGSYVKQAVARTGLSLGTGFAIGRIASTKKGRQMRSKSKYAIPQDCIKEVITYAIPWRAFAKKGGGYRRTTLGALEPRRILTKSRAPQAKLSRILTKISTKRVSDPTKAKAQWARLIKVDPAKLGRLNTPAVVTHLKKVGRYAIPQDCIQCYEGGIREGLQQQWRGLKWKMKQVTQPAVKWVRMQLLPTISEGAIKGTLTGLQQETGALPPTTIDLEPLKILSLSSSYRDIPNASLEALILGLRERYLQAAGTELRKALLQKIVDVQVELQGRSI